MLEASYYFSDNDITAWEKVMINHFCTLLRKLHGEEELTIFQSANCVR